MVVDGCLQHQFCLVGKFCLLIVECHLVIIIHIVVHHVCHALQWFVTTSEQMLLYHTNIVERINLIALLDPCQCFFLAIQFTQHGSLQTASLVVMTIADQRTFQLVEGIFPTFVCCTDTSCLVVTGISPSLIPCGLPEKAVSCFQFSKELVYQCQIEQWLAVVWIRIALLQHFHSCL